MRASRSATFTRSLGSVTALLSRAAYSAAARARAVERFRWLEQELSMCRLPALILWGREDEVFDHATFATRFKKMLPHADGPHLVTGRHFLQEDSGPEIAAHIKRFLKEKRSQ